MRLSERFFHYCNCCIRLISLLLGLLQLGYRKWGHDFPEWYARSATSTTPDWYSRRVGAIRSGDLTHLMWKPWDQTSKPSEKKVYGIVREPRHRPWMRGYQAPLEVDGRVQVPRWGLYHPHHYQEPARCEPLPPVHADEKHL